jgi:hypothetical protein
MWVGSPIAHIALLRRHAVAFVMLDRRETKEDHLQPCIAQVTAIREVADVSPLPRRGPHSPFIYLRPSRVIHKCVPHKQWIEQWKPLAYRGMEGVSSCSDKRRVQSNQKLFRQKCGPRTRPSWLGVGLMHFKPIRESKN